MLNKANVWMQRWMPILTPTSLVIGVMLEDVGHQFLFLVPWLFAFMTFASSLGMNFNDAKSFTKYPKTILICIAFLHIIMPIWAYFLSTVIFDDDLLIIGYIISVAVPTGVTSIIWVSICKGNLPLGLSIVLIDTLLSPIIMPALLHIVAGEKIAIDTASLIMNLVWMIVLPSVLGVLLNELTKGSVQQTLGKKLSPFSKLCLFGVVMINSSAIAPYLQNITWELAAVIVVVFILAASGYAIAFVLGHFIWKDFKLVTTLVFVGGMRNIAVGVIVATTYFPAKVAMPVVFGMLFQQVLASLFSKVLERYELRYKPELQSTAV